MKIASFSIVLLILCLSVYAEEVPQESESTEPAAEVEVTEGPVLLQTVEPEVELSSTEENFLLHLPSDMIRLGEQESVARSFPVSQCISGSRVRGTGELSGAYDQALIDDTNAATWQVDFSGVSHSKTRASQDRVTSFQRGTLDFQSQGKVTYTFSGFAIEGLSTSGNLTTRRTGIRMPYRGLRRRIAMRRINERRGSHRRTAERLGIRDLASSFREELTGRVAELNTQYQESVLAPLRQNDIYPSISRVSSDTGSLHVGLRFDGQDQPELQVPMENFHAGDQLRLAVHQSGVNNMARSIQGETRSLAETLRGLVATGDESETEESGLQIKFAAAQPLRVVFTGENINITLKGDSFENAGQAYGPMEIGFSYRVEYREGQQYLVSVDEPTVQRPESADGSRPKMGLRELSLRRVLLNVLQRDLPKIVAVGELQMPFQLDMLHPTDIERLTCDNGWLVLEATRDMEATSDSLQIATTDPIPASADTLQTVSFQTEPTK